MILYRNMTFNQKNKYVLFSIFSAFIYSSNQCQSNEIFNLDNLTRVNECVYLIACSWIYCLRCIIIVHRYVNGNNKTMLCKNVLRSE